MELLITVVIIGIVISIGYPSYIQHTTKTRRTEAMGTLMNVAGAQEKFFMQNNAYTSDLGPDGLVMNLKNADGDVVADGTYTTSGYYRISLALPEGGGFIATATLDDQDTDAKCKTFTLDHTGLRGATGTSPGECWQ